MHSNFFHWIKGKLCYHVQRLLCCHGRINSAIKLQGWDLGNTSHRMRTGITQRQLEQEIHIPSHTQLLKKNNLKKVSRLSHWSLASYIIDENIKAHKSWVNTLSTDTEKFTYTTIANRWLPQDKPPQLLLHFAPNYSTYRLSLKCHHSM